MDQSFAALQFDTYSNQRKSNDGTENESHPMAFSVAVADTETFYYGTAMKQLDKHFL